MPTGRDSLPALALGLALASSAGACGSRPDAEVAPGVLLVVIDALRADHLGLHGYDRDTAPVLGELAREGLHFEQAFASAPLLVPAHIALLTGCEPSVARRFLAPELEGASTRRWAIPARAPHMAVEFLTAGYATAAFLDHPALTALHGAELGFQHHEHLDPASAERWEGPQSTRVVDHFLKWLGSVPRSRPWFALLHLNQLERFWSERGPGSEGFFQPRPELDQIPPVANTDSVFFAVPRSRWRGGVRTLGQYEAAYDDEIRRLDAELGRLCASLRSQGRYESTTLAVLGAFGMQLGEAGLYLSSGRYSMADLAVPWVLRPRAGLGDARGRSLPGLVSTVDLAPTLLALEELAVPPGMSGLSQAAAVRGGAPAVTRPFVYASCGLQEGCAVIGERHALEYIVPRGTADAQLRRSWMGEWSEHAIQPQVFFYDRLATRFPPLDGQGVVRDPEQAPYRAAAVEWLRTTNERRLAFLGHVLADAAPDGGERDDGQVGAAR